MIEMSRKGPDEQQQQLNYREVITDAGCFVTTSLVYGIVTLYARRFGADSHFGNTHLCKTLYHGRSTSSPSQLTRAAGLRCLGTIRKGGCNLEYRGGKQLRERH